MTNRTARNRPRADRAEHKRVARDRAERKRVARIRAERTRSRYASVRAFVERLNAQPYELFKPRRRPPLSSRQFSLSTRVNRCLTSSILSTPVQSLSRQQHSFDTCSTVVSLTVFLDTRSIFVSPTLFSQYAPRFAFSIAVRLPLPHHPLSSLCWHSAVVSALLSFTRCRAVGWKGLFALCFAFSTDEWTRSGNESVELEMDLVESRFVESRWK